MLDTWRPLCVWCVMASMPLHPSADRTRFNFECHVSSVTSYTCRHVMSSFVQPCNQKNDIWSFRPKSRPTINIDWPESWILSAQSFYKDSCGFSVASLFDGWGVINSVSVLQENCGPEAWRWPTTCCTNWEPNRNRSSDQETGWVKENQNQNSKKQNQRSLRRREGRAMSQLGL